MKGWAVPKGTPFPLNRRSLAVVDGLCMGCGKPLAPHDYEQASIFRIRRTCGHECSGAARRMAYGHESAA
jgi:hypothetical protein